MNTAGRPVPAEGSLAEQARLAIEEKIVTLQFPPGQVLVENNLVRFTGIGRTPVREAVQRLAADGLLQVLPRKGLMVTPVRRVDLAAMLEVRKVLERLVVVKSAERATQDQCDGLQVLASDFGSAGGDAKSLLRSAVRLDELLGAACHNQFLSAALAATQGQYCRAWQLFRGELDPARFAQLHRGLAQAVADGECAGAVRARDEIIAVLERRVSGLDTLS